MFSKVQADLVTRTDKVLAGLGLTVLIVLHLDFWRTSTTTLYGGWLPEELAYRLVWMLLAGLYLGFFCARIWRDEDPES